MKHNPSRRQFLGSFGKILGGTAAAGMYPKWAFAVAPARDVVTRSFWTMGTAINLSAVVERDHVSVFTDAFAELSRIDETLSAHRTDSELGRLNATPGQWIPASRAMLDVAGASRRIGELTGGALDVTVLPHLRRLGYMPALDGVSTDSFRSDFRSLGLRGSTVHLAENGSAVDFGGIAKGYGVDVAVASVRKSGVKAALLEAGGDLVAIGRPASDRRWKVGIRDPHDPAGVCVTLEVEDEAVATSGTYAQVRGNAGSSHIVDPATGRSVRHVKSVTVVTQEAMDADALATALSVMSKDAGKAFVERTDSVEAFWIYEDGEVFVTRGLRERVVFV